MRADGSGVASVADRYGAGRERAGRYAVISRNAEDLVGERVVTGGGIFALEVLSDRRGGPGILARHGGAYRGEHEALVIVDAVRRRKAAHGEVATALRGGNSGRHCVVGVPLPLVGEEPVVRVAAH